MSLHYLVKCRTFPHDQSYILFCQTLHTHPFNGPLSGTTQLSQYQKGKTNLDVKQETVSGSGIHWAICKSAPRCRQITMPAPHRQFFTVRMPFLPPNQQHQSSEGTAKHYTTLKNSRLSYCPEI